MQYSLLKQFHLVYGSLIREYVSEIISQLIVVIRHFRIIVIFVIYKLPLRVDAHFDQLDLQLLSTKCPELPTVSAWRARMAINEKRQSLGEYFVKSVSFGPKILDSPYWVYLNCVCWTFYMLLHLSHVDHKWRVLYQQSNWERP